MSCDAHTTTRSCNEYERSGCSATTNTFGETRRPPRIHSFECFCQQQLSWRPVNSTLKYENFNEATCPFSAWSKADKILLVGDSIMSQLFEEYNHIMSSRRRICADSVPKLTLSLIHI